MKQFFKFIFASCLGTILALGLLILIMVAVGAASSSSDSTVSNKSVLLLELDNAIPEKSGNIQNEGLSFEPKPSTGLHEMTKLINHAKSDSRIEGIVYKVATTTPLGTVTASTIRESLKEFRDSTDKFVYTYGDFYSNTSYLIASSSDSIYINPNGSLDVNGYGAMVPFFKGFLDKIGVKMSVFYAGKFKSATEPFRRKEMSEQNRIQTREYLTDNYQLYLEEVAEARDIPESNLKSVINELKFDNSQDALDRDLVDVIEYWFQFEDMLRAKLGLKEGKKVKYISIEDYAKKTTLKAASKSKNKIAVVIAEGEVAYQSSNKGEINGSVYHKIFDDIRKDDKIKAVVLRVNSPGGSAFTSDIIWKEMKELKARGLPVVASFGDYAASGGYYVAACADKIVSHPKTLTGSIGVFSMMPDMTELMEEKLEIRFDTVKTSPHAIAFSPFLKFDDKEKTMMQQFTDEMYEKFLSRVAEGRGKSRDEINEVAQGRVWTGQKGLEIGLVDELGDLNTAIEIAAGLADVADDYKIDEYPKIKKEVWEELAEQLMASNATAQFRQKSITKSDLYKQYLQVEKIMQYREPMARLPFVIQ